MPGTDTIIHDAWQIKEKIVSQVRGRIIKRSNLITSEKIT